MITEPLMRPGTGSIRFRPGMPVRVSETIRGWIDENNGGVGASVVITRTPVDVGSLSAADILSAALYRGDVTDRPSRLELTVAGMSSWLDTYLPAGAVMSTSTPLAVLTGLLTNGLTVGTTSTTGTTPVTRWFQPYSVTARDALDRSAELGGWEYRVNPDLTVDAAVPSTLFRQAGDFDSVVVVASDGRGDGSLRGVEADLLNQALTGLGSRLPTDAVALGRGSGTGVVTGSATRALNLLAPDGTAPEMVTVFSSASEEDANVDASAASFLAVQGARRKVEVASLSERVRTFVEPGDEVFLYDLPSGLFVTTEQVTFRGETIFPIRVRLLELTWPVGPSYGVYVLSNDGQWLDVTRWVVDEGRRATWTVGDWAPSISGPTNRTAPEVEERLSSGLSFSSNAKELTDAGSRQFIRADNTRAGAQLEMRGVENATTDANGDLTITFPEAFTVAPTIVVSRRSSSTTARTAAVVSSSTTGFVVRCFNNTGVAQTSTAGVEVHWIAIGYKNIDG